MLNNHKTEGEWKIHSGNMLTDHKSQGEWKIHLIMASSFISSKDSYETRKKKKKSDNIEIMMYSGTDELIDELFEFIW